MKKAKRLAAYLLAIVLIVSQLTCMCGVTAFADGLPSALSDSLLHGVNLHNSGKYAYQSIYSAIMEAKALGSNVVRFNYDPGEDGYSADDLSYVLSVAEILEENDMELVLVLDGFNQIFTDDDDSYTNSVIATNYGVLANRLAGKVAYYQIGNEIDNYYEQYSTYNFASKAVLAQKAASALKAARTAIKGADSSAKFILNFGWTHYDFLDAIYDLGYEWDVTGFDWYSDMSDLTSANFYETVIDTVVKDFETPVIVCETGLTPVDDNGTVDYVSNVEWLCDFAKYCEDNKDVLGFILYELYDEGDPYVNNVFEKENCFGLFDFSKNEKAITPYIRALFGGETNSRVTNPTVPANSYAASDAAIDTQGVANQQGKLFSYLGDNITHKGLTPVDISGYLSIEFDLYVEDYDSFMIAYNNAGFSNSSGTSSFRFRLLNTASIANNMAIADLDIDQINQSGWNHITVNYNKFDKYSFDPASVTGYDLYIENYGGIQNRNYLNATSGMVFAIANLYATGMDTSGQIPAVSNVYTTVAQLNPGNPKDFSGFDLAYRLGLNQEGLTPVDFSDADYVEFDLYVESKTRLFNAISAIDTADAGVNHRLSLRLSSNSSNCTTDALRIDELPNYIKNDGWNHIVAKYEGDTFGSYNGTAVCSWVVSFENTWARGIGTDVSGIIGGNTFVVANICGTKMVGPAMNNVMGESVGSLNANNGLITSGWRFGRYYDAGCYQENLTPVDLSEADYIELDMFVESRQGILDAIADLDSKNGDGGARWRLLLSSTPDDYNGSNYANVYFVESFEDYITKDGWNHIAIPVSAFEHNGSATLSSIASWGINFYIGTDDTNIAKDQTLAVYNICGTKITAPALHSVIGTTVGILNENNGLITSGWRFGRYYDAGCYQENLTPVDLSEADYIELDMFVESRQGILDAIADLDSKNGDGGARWRLLLSSTPDDYNGNNYANVYYIESFEDYITKDGWNHIVIPVSAFEHNGSATLSSIASWGINFYIGTDDTNIAKDQKLAVFNLCGSKIVACEKANTNGTTVNDLNAGNGLITSGWRFGRYYDAGCYQEDLTPVDLSGADYIEFDMFVESRQGILDAIADLDSKNGDAGARWRFLLSSTPSDYNGNNYANVYYVEFFENYITKDGWNHIAIPVSEFEHNGSATLSSIASWGINFYVGTGDTNIAKDQKLAVCNICGTKAYTDVAGDVNNDGTTNILDLIRAKKLAANMKVEYNPNAATFNAAGLMSIARMLLGIPG